MKESWLYRNINLFILFCFLATSLCFNERSTYTQEVLAVVIQKLIEITPIPVLFMRTVLQALSSYPRMVGFVMNMLQRLITKQVRRNFSSFPWSTIDCTFALGMETSSHLGRFHKVLSENTSTFVPATSHFTDSSTKKCSSSGTRFTWKSSASCSFDVSNSSNINRGDIFSELKTVSILMRLNYFVWFQRANVSTSAMAVIEDRSESAPSETRPTPATASTTVEQ